MFQKWFISIKGQQNGPEMNILAMKKQKQRVISMDRDNVILKTLTVEFNFYDNFHFQVKSFLHNLEKHTMFK